MELISLRAFGRRRGRTRGGRERLPEGTYIELVQSLFGHTVPAAIMTACFAGTGALLLGATDDAWLLLFYGLGLIASGGRLLILFGERRRVLSPTLGIHVAGAIERRFGAAYIAFALALGVFAARAYAIVDPHLQIPVVALVYGYCAGVAATVALRLWVSGSAIVAAVAPMVLVAAFMPGSAHWATALLTVLFSAGGILSMAQRCRETAAQISMRRLMETLARQDDLTGLPNRLVLRERFERLIARADPSEMVAVHCIDINQLEPVNEMYGHMAGDALLKAVAHRLRRLVKGDNMAIHLNGDDFVVIQPHLTDLHAAEALAAQIVATLDKSYTVAGQDIVITATIGYAVDLQHGADLERLLSRAERALAGSKRGKTSGVVAWDGTGRARRNGEAP